jgi:outer membrane immunogenic protein
LAIDNKWLVGLEADFQGSGEKDSRARDPLSFSVKVGEQTVTLSENETLEAKIKWFGTARARLGWLVTPTLLLYGPGGLAYGRIDVNSTATATLTGSTTGLISSASSRTGESKTKLGWTVGGGIEGALFDSRYWTWKN